MEGPLENTERYKGKDVTGLCKLERLDGNDVLRDGIRKVLQLD